MNANNIISDFYFEESHSNVEEKKQDPICQEMLCVKFKLENLMNANATAEIKKDLHKIKESVKTFLKTHCVHEIVNDYVDITPDRSMKILYCKLCETVF